MPHRDRSGRASGRIKDYGKWHHSGGDQWERVHSANSPDRMVAANDGMWEAAGNGAL
ncbi:hypothetical protein GOZ94_27920 [Agrobacterium vitis]|uniref:hypothetical protein n=1 Tax=Agrobacterium vitis TaxID=373 RepID=UPI0012E815EE|nr:hypothetical protein [Agrobacterium vitis]MVA22734.1 hypothetical protein [Agrobacterium vitis]